MQFNISFDGAGSPDLGSLTASEQQAVLDTANAAAAIWARYLPLANITLDLAIKVDDSLFSGLAEGRPGDFVATGNTFNDQQVYDAGSAIKLRTGQDSNGAAADLSIGLTVSSIRSMFFKTDEYGPIPTGNIDALSVFLREIEHGLGMYSLAGEPGAPGVSVYDTFVQNDVNTGLPIFTGLNAITAYYWGAPGVPLDPTSTANIVGPIVGVPGTLGNDLMALVPSPDTNIHISGTDIGILRDIGVPMNVATEGDDIVYGIESVGYFLQDGNDIGYALAGGSILDGGAGNDRLIGNIGSDILSGDLGDDYLEGGGGNDSLWGNNGFDIAHYTGLASDYQLSGNASLATITDLRPNSPDGYDQLSSIEAVQWGDGSITLLNLPPSVTVQNVSVHGNTTIALSSLFMASDPEGDPILGYQVLAMVNSNDPQGGFFTVGGVDYHSGPIYVSAAQLASATYTTGSLPTTTLEIRAVGADAGSDWTQFTVSLTSANNLPVVSTSNLTAAHGQTLALSSLFRVSDADNDTITHYQLRDATNAPGSGHYVVNGVAQAEGTVIDITAAQLAQTSFVTGRTGDSVQIRAFDDLAWSAADSTQWASFTITVKTSGDFDGDLNPDLLWQSDTGQAALWFMNGSSFSSGAAVGNNPGASWHVKGAGDFDGDGKADMLWQNDDGQAALWLLNGSTVADGVAFANNPGPSWHVVAARDFDRDGKSDILWQNDSGQAALWFINGTTFTNGAVLSPNPGSSWHIKGAGDFDGDGKSDLVWQDNSGQAQIWLMDDSTVTSNVQVGSNPGASWHVIGAGDFDGDGKSDILWQNDSGQAAIWFMNSATVSSTALAGSNPGPSWQIKGTSDLNDDGMSDILWQSTSGQAAAWMMSGSNVLSTVAIGANPGPGWHIIAAGN